MAAMTERRINKIRLVKLGGMAELRCSANILGKITSLVNMVLKVRVATMIIAVAADNPPTNTNICSNMLPLFMARPKT